MKTIKDLVDFLSKLDGDYPIPYIDTVADVEVKSIFYYSLTWAETMFRNDSVDCTFYTSWDINLSDTTVTNVEIRTKDTLYYGLKLDESIPKLNKCLRELYGTN